RAQEARSTPSRMTSFMIAHFAELDAHNRLPDPCVHRKRVAVASASSSRPSAVRLPGGGTGNAETMIGEPGSGRPVSILPTLRGGVRRAIQDMERTV
ncbi:hypothetical protein NKJ16_29580, partial [Mesorhizobium sp. M0179]|uniref:hypothetical protein n=1 Tax=Mesorhizobium sp. M0179 TaxID=2956905 RepID=UPI00333CFF52